MNFGFYHHRKYLQSMRHCIKWWAITAWYLPLITAAQVRVETQLSAVKLYQQGAEVHRKATIHLRPGVQTLHLTNVYHRLLPQSIRIRGIGEWNVLSVEFRKEKQLELKTHPKLRDLYAQLDNTRSKRREKEAQIQTLNDLIHMLTGNAAADTKRKDPKKVQQPGGTPLSLQLELQPTELKRFQEVLLRRLNEYRVRILQLQSEIENLAEKERTLIQELKPLEQQVRKRVEGYIELLVEAKIEEDVPLEISYILPDAHWQSHYDIHASTEEEQLTVGHYAIVEQQSGEDWTGIPLTVAMGSPLISVSVPQLQPWYLSLDPPVVIYRQHRAAEAPIGGKPYTREDAAPKHQPLAERQETALNLQYHIDHVGVSIPSGQKRKILLESHHPKASFIYVMVLKYSNTAFLEARLANWYSYFPVSAEAQIIVDGAVGSKTYIDVQNPEDTLQLALGRVEAIVGRRQRIGEYKKVNKLTGKATRQRKWQISVKNNLSRTVTVEIREPIPISTDKSISIDYQIPHNGVVDPASGILKWILSLQPHQSIRFQYGYSARYPAKKVLWGWH